MASIGKVSAVFTASTGGLTSGVNQASSAFKKMGSDVASLKTGMGGLLAMQGAQLFASVASAASSAARSLFAMGQGSADTIDKTSKLSRQLGLTYGELAGLKLAGDLAGVSMETIGKAATKADVAFVKAQQGSKVAQAAFAGIGLSVDQLEGKSPAERFQAISDAISTLPTAAERSRAAIALFGKAGADMLPLFEGGAGTIRAATEEAERFGLALTSEQGQSVEGMNDAFTRAQMAVEGVVQQVVAYLAPALQSVTDTFSNLIGGIGGANIGSFIGEGIINGAIFLATIGDAVIAGLSVVFEYVSGVAAQFGTVFDIGNRVAAAFSLVGNTLSFIFGAAILGITAPVTALLKGANYLAGLAGIDIGADSFLAGADAFNNSIVASMDAAAKGAATDFANMTADKPTAPEATKGPLSTGLADALAKARADSAAKKADDQAATTKPPTAPPTLPPAKKEEPAFTGVSTEALKGTDSSSKEGVAEMFRLMRGDGGDVQERIAASVEKIADNTGEGEDMEVYDLAG